MMRLKYLIWLPILLSLVGETVVFGHVAGTQPRIAILTAMQSESQAIARHLNHKKNIQLNGVSYTLGKYNGKSVILTPTGIGKINAAAITTATIDTFHPKAVLFAGIAGKLNKRLKTGDIVIGKSLYEVEHLTENKPDPDFINAQTKRANTPLLFSDARLVKLSKNLAKANTLHSKVVIGRIATTDIFPPDKYSSQSAINSHSIAIEMEGFSALAVSQLYHTPCLIIRAISDDSTLSLKGLYSKNKYSIPATNEQIAENNMAAFVMLIIKNYPPNINSFDHYFSVTPL